MKPFRDYDNTFIFNFTTDIDHTILSTKSWFDKDNCVVTKLSYAESVASMKRVKRYLDIAKKICCNSRIYIIAHCDKNSDYLFASRKSDAAYIHYTDFSLHLSKILEFCRALLQNNSDNNLTISLISCRAANGENDYANSFASKLQLELQRTYGIYVNILARILPVALFKGAKCVIHENDLTRYQAILDRKIYAQITEAKEKEYLTCLHYQLSGSKRFFFWHTDGRAYSVDAYEYKQGYYFKKDLIEELCAAISPSVELDSLIDYIKLTPAWQIAKQPNVNIFRYLRSPLLTQDPDDIEDCITAIQEVFADYNGKIDLVKTPVPEAEL
jgi:hypothetical protein